MKNSIYEAFYHQLFDHAKVGIIICDFNGNIIDVNTFFAEMVSYTVDELKSMNMIGFLDPDELIRYPLSIEQVRQGTTTRRDRRLRDRHGIFQVFEFHSQKLTNEIALVLVHDISARQEALQKSEDKYRLIVENAQEGIWEMDATHRTVFVNHKMAAMLGYQAPEMTGRVVESFMLEEDLADHSAKMEKRHQGVNASYERRFVKKDGTICWTRVTASPIRDDKGVFLGSFGFFTDITEWKETEEHLRHLGEMVNNAPNSITIHDLQGNFLYANEKTFELHQYSREEFSRINLHQLDVPESEALIQERIDKIMQKGSAQFPVRHYRKDGTSFPLEVFVKLLEWKGKPALLSIATDITEQEKFLSALRESEQKYRQIAENTSDVIWMMNDRMQYTYVSPSIFKQRGYTPQEFMNLKIDEVYAPDSVRIITEVFRRSLELARQGKLPRDHSVTLELQHRCKDGSLIYSEVHTNPVFDDEGNIVAAHGVSRDITRRKLAESALKESEDKFRGFFENAPMGIWVEDFSAVKQEVEIMASQTDNLPEYLMNNREVAKRLASLVRVIEVNQTSVNILGEPDKDSVSRNILNYLSETSLDGLINEIIAFHKGKSRLQGEVPVKTRAGLKYLSLSVAIDPGHLDTWSRVLVSFTDVTLQKKMERELRNREMLLSRIFDILPVGLWFADQHGTLIRGNPEGNRIWGTHPMVDIDEYGRFSARRLPSGLPVAPDDWALAHTIREGITITDELLEIDAFDGKKKIILNYTAPIQDERGKIDGAVIMNLDITDRVNAEQKIRILAEFQSDLLRMNLLADIHQLITGKVYSLIGNGVVFSAHVDHLARKAKMISWAGFNIRGSAVANILGYDPTLMEFDLSGMQPEEVDLFRSGQLVEFQGGLAALAGHRMEPETGRKIESLLGIRKVFVAGYCYHGEVLGALAILTFNDITPELETIEMLLNQASISIHRIRTEESLREIEERFRLAFHTSPDAININRKEDGVFVDVNDGFCHLTGYCKEEVVGRTSLEINLWANPDDRNQLVELLNKDGQVVNFEAVFRYRDGRLRTGLMSASLIMLNGVSNIISITRDIEELKQVQADLVSAKEAAEEASRLKTAFLNNISHEVRTPMNAIMGFTELMQSGEVEPHEKDRFIGIIHSNGKQLLSIIDDVLEISRLDSGRIPLNLVPFSLNELMEDLYISLKAIPGRKELQFQYTCDDRGLGDLVTADREKIRQVIAGFIGNAVKFTQTGMVSFGYVKHPTEVEFFVRDTGIGIPLQEQERIFERFYQILPESMQGTRGTGLGLSIARGLANFMKGNIRVESSPGKGSVFYLSVPYLAHSKEPEQPAPVIPFTMKELTILVAEDVDYNYELAEILLGRKTKQMIRACNGAEVLERLSETIPDLILMDLKMPVMDGYEATRRVREKYPDLPIIALTAYTQPEEEQKALEAGCNAFISKPINHQELIGTIHRTVSKIRKI